MASERPKRARISAERRTPRRSTSASRAGGSVTTPVRRATRSWRSTPSAPPRHALVALQRLLQVLHAAAAVAEDLEDADAGGVAERLEEIRLQVLQLEPPAWLGHDKLNIAI